MTEAEQLNQFVNIFKIPLGAPPDKLERFLLTPCLRAVTEEMAMRLRNYRNAVEKVVKSQPKNLADAPKALEELRKFRSLETEQGQALRVTLELLTDLGFETTEWNIEVEPMKLPVPGFPNILAPVS